MSYNKVWEMHARDRKTISEIAEELRAHPADVKHCMIFAWKMNKCCNWHYDSGYEARHAESNKETAL